jgi:hypothetical protein
MKFISTLALLLFSTCVFATTAYSFKCVTANDGQCPITTSNAHVMTLIEPDLYGGSEGEYSLFQAIDPDATYMFVYKGNTMLAQAANSTYLAVPTSNGFVGIILVDNKNHLPAFINP